MNKTLRVVLLVAVIVTGGCRQQSSSQQVSDPMAGAVAPTPTQLSGFIKLTGIPIPTSAEPVRFYSKSGFLDGAIWLQFRLPAAQLSQFIAASPIPPAKVRSGPADSPGVFHSFHPWLLAAPKTYQYAHTQIAPGRHVNCIFDLDDPQTTVVYLMWFTT